MATGRLPDPNSSPLTAKGDLYTYSTVPAKLAVGSNGETLVADSSASTGLRWQGNFAAGKNKVINGAFDIWQRGTSFSNVNGTYTADRWTMDLGGGVPTSTTSQQTFTPGAAPVAGYEGQYFFRYAHTALNGATAIEINTKIEDVRTLAGQTATISFWAKSSTSNTISVSIRQVFGSGGSGSVDTTATSSLTLTTSWQRYSYTVSIPSVSGKTIGSGSFLRPYFSMPITATVNFDLWGVQLEAGNTATAFQTATGTLAGELAACQRYYWRISPAQYGIVAAPCIGTTTTGVRGTIPFSTVMRVAPTSIDFSSLEIIQFTTAALNQPAVTNVTFTSVGTNTNYASLEFASGAASTTQGYSGFVRTTTSTGYLGLSAEL